MPQLFTALVTPFDNFNNVDYNALSKLVTLQKQNNVDGLVILGTTAESELLTRQEQLKIIEHICELAGHDLKIVVGCGKSSTHETLDLAENAMKFPINSVMVVSPPYVKPSPTGLIEHFRILSDHKIPFIAYHHPFRTGCNPSITTLESILNLPFCMGLKDASGGCDVMKQLALKYPIFSGDDGLLIPHLSLGAAGIISVCSNLIPGIFKKTLDVFYQNPHEALRIFSSFHPFIDAVFKEPNPIGIKTALHLAHLINEEFRLPYTKAEEKNRQEILKFLIHLPNLIGEHPNSTSALLI